MASLAGKRKIELEKRKLEEAQSGNAVKFRFIDFLNAEYKNFRAIKKTPRLHRVSLDFNQI